MSHRSRVRGLNPGDVKAWTVTSPGPTPLGLPPAPAHSLSCPTTSFLLPETPPQQPTCARPSSQGLP